jgi:hypothetical protein
MKKNHPTWKGLARMIVDGMRAVDVLQALDDVDPTGSAQLGIPLEANRFFSP